jgi:hypothetical protein
MKRILPFLCLVSTLFLIVACTTTPESEVTTEEAPNPFVGTWVLNVDKSEFNPPESALKSDVVVIEAQENGLKFTFDRVDAEGNAIHIEAAPKFDGQSYPITGDPTSNMVSLTRLGENSFEWVTFKDDDELGRTQVVFSDDGKTSTATSTPKDGVTSIFIYDKQ